MLKHITLTCFRKHESLHVEFARGLSVVRAPNEGGKSSLLEAIAYALYGTRALRTSLDDAATWGHTPKELKVELLIESGGKDYLFVRSKGGAEVSLNGEVFCTGQGEVSALAATLIGADAATAQNLMLANQAGLRGVLTSGPKATAAMIESLGDFDLFDRLLEAAQSRLALGSPAMIESRIAHLEEELAQLQLPARPDEAQYLSSLEAMQKTQRAHLHEIDAVRASGKTLHSEHAAELERRRAAAELTRARAQLSGQLQQIENDLSALDLSGEIIDTEPLNTRIAEAEQYAARRTAYDKFLALPRIDERMARAEHKTQSVRVQEEMAGIGKAIHAAEVDIKVAASKRVAASSCGFCGQDVSAFPEVATRNLKLQEQIDALTRDIAGLEQKQGTLKATTAQLAKLTECDEAQRGALKGIGRWLDIDENTVPATVTWAGTSPAEAAPNLDSLRAELRHTRSHNEMLNRARAKQETLLTQRERLSAEASRLEEQHVLIETLDERAFAKLERDLAHATEALERLNAAERAVANSLAECERVYDEALRAWQQGERMAESFNKQIASAREELVTLEFNNQLVKKVRSARPVVGNKLWSMVLASVSTIFSALRGEKSIVSREGGGFAVNGQNVESLSGSTLDLLGLAIRTALIRTFIPACPLLVLDEPGASMDSQRELALLGYLASSTFSQILLVTHSDATEAMGNNVIRLGV